MYVKMDKAKELNKRHYNLLFAKMRQSYSFFNNISFNIIILFILYYIILIATKIDAYAKSYLIYIVPFLVVYLHSYKL